MRGLWILAWVALLGSGCIYSSKVEGKKFRMPSEFNARAGKAKGAKQAAFDQAKSGKGVGRWWEAFGDKRLNTLIKHALKENLDLQAAYARLDQARQQLVIGTAGWFPAIGGNALVARNRSLFNAPQIGAQAFEQNTMTFSVQASYEFDLWGRIRYGRKAAKHGVSASYEDLRTTYLSLVANIVDSYFLVVQQRSQAKLLASTIETRKSQLKLVERRYRSGVAKPSDLHQAIQSVAQAEADHVATLSALRVAENALAVLIGRYPGKAGFGELDQLPKAVSDYNVGVPAKMLSQRPDVRAAYQRLLASDAQVGQALAEHFPQLSIGGNIGARIDPTGLIWQIFASLTAPLFQGGRINANYKLRKAALREQLANFRRLLRTSVREVEDALVRSRYLVKRIDHLKKRVNAAESAVRLTMDQYAQGLTILLNVLNSEQNVTAARVSLLQARRELVSARVSLARALGGNWMDKEIARRTKD